MIPAMVVGTMGLPAGSVDNTEAQGTYFSMQTFHTALIFRGARIVFHNRHDGIIR